MSNESYAYTKNALFRKKSKYKKIGVSDARSGEEILISNYCWQNNQG